MKTHCDRCGKDCRNGKFNFVPPWELVELKRIYKTRFVEFVCKGCGDVANSFVNYYGKKKPEDMLTVNKFLRNGKVSGELEISIYSQLNNAGYY